MVNYGGGAAWDWGPSDQGLISWNYDIGAASEGGANPLGTAGTLYVMALPVRAPVEISNIWVVLDQNGSALTAGQCFAALYQGAAGGQVLGQTADQSAAWAADAVSALEMPLAGGPVTAMPGVVRVALWFNGTTGPSFWRAPSSPVPNTGLAAAASRWATANTGVTTTAPATLSALAAATNAYWAGLS